MEKDRIDMINNILFGQLEKLANTDDETLDTEIERSKAMAVVTSQFIAAETLKMRKEVFLSSGKDIKLIGGRNDI